MAKQILKFKITSVTPLIMHNGKLASPIYEFTKRIKAITSKRKKTDADHAEISKLEWYGSLYLDNNVPVIPGEVMEATLINAAKNHKLGKQAKSCVYCLGNFKLEYDGPKNIDKLWEKEEFRLIAKVRVNQNSVMRTRPIFNTWHSTIEIEYDDKYLSKSDMKQIVQQASENGLMDWRPRFGKFDASNFN